MKWQINQGQLVRTFELENFVQCVEFLRRVTIVAEELQHHPDVEINQYKYITFKLSTHDSDSITEKDHELASRIDHLFGDV